MKLSYTSHLQSLEQMLSSPPILIFEFKIIFINRTREVLLMCHRFSILSLLSSADTSIYIRISEYKAQYVSSLPPRVQLRGRSNILPEYANRSSFNSLFYQHMLPYRSYWLYAECWARLPSSSQLSVVSMNFTGNAPKYSAISCFTPLLIRSYYIILIHCIQSWNVLPHSIFGSVLVSMNKYYSESS